MMFSQEFVADLNRLDFFGEPFALVRFADGERALCEGRPIRLHNEFESWQSTGESTPFTQLLNASLRADLPGYCIGISCPCCDEDAHRWYLKQVTVPRLQLTFSNLFVNGNHDRFLNRVEREKFTERCVIVSSGKGQFCVPRQAVNDDWDMDGLVEQLCAVDRPILVAAGPAANVLIHKYWQRATRRQTIVDVGSALDGWIHGAGTRNYHRPDHPNRKKICRWSGRSSHVTRTKPDGDERTAAEPGSSPAADGLPTDRITAVLTAYRRPSILVEQVQAVRAQTARPQQIWLWANEPDGEMRGVLRDLNVDRVVVSSENAGVHPRFALALLAPTPYVAIFDDDAIPGTRWFANCLSVMHESPGILGSAGVRLNADGYLDRTMFGWHTPGGATVEVDLVGHAWFLMTEWIKYLFDAPAGAALNGEDIELSARAWRLAGIRTFCPPHPPDDRGCWGSTRGTELGSDEVAASRRADHLAERDRIVRQEIGAGWQPLFRRDGRHTTTTQAEQAPDGEPRLDAAAAQEADSRPVSKATDASSDVQASIPGSLGAYQQLLQHIPDPAARLLIVARHVRELAHPDRADSRPAVAVIDLDAFPPAELKFVERAILRRVDERADAGGPFDAVVLHDVLGQCDRPRELLDSLRRRLAPGGTIVADTANVQHERTVRALLEGRWQPSSSGLAGQSHDMRFFTASELEKLFYRAGYDVRELSPLDDGARATWPGGNTTSLDQYERLRVPPGRRIRETGFQSQRLLVRATPTANRFDDLTSIVILTHNQLPYTRGCLESIRFYTDEPYELVLVDNGSTDGTVEWLGKQPDVRLITNAENRGFPAGANQGIRAARGDSIVLLNNDTLVGTGWLRRMLAALRRAPRTGLVGPVSNNVSGEQQVAVDYTDLAQLDGFAWRWGREHDGQTMPTDRLVGFCLAFPRSLVDEIGLLDERFGIGNFEDDDYCRRAIEAGYQPAVARDAYVHHFGHCTFAATGVDLNTLLTRNEALYRQKWANERNAESPPPAKAAPARLRAPAETAPNETDAAAGPLRVEAAEGGGLRLVRARLRISLCMIVRDNTDTIEACLSSIKPWVDEMVIVDTGSTDDTPEIARRYGARLFDFPWCDDFAAARNESIRHAGGEWVFWMDSDDTIDPENGRKLRALADGNQDGNTLGYVMQVHCPAAPDEGPSDVTVVDHVKMFRNHRGLSFECRIHEQVLPSIREAGGDVAFTDIFVVHSGSDHSPAGQKRKIARDLHLLELELHDRPNHPFALFNLGMTYADIDEHAQAVDALRKSLEFSGAQDSHVRKVHALLVASLMRLERYDEAEQAGTEGLRSFPDDPELRFRQGMLLHELGRCDEAEVAYLCVLRCQAERHFSSIDRGILGYKARHNLAIVYADMGRLSDAEVHWRSVTEDAPDHRAGWRGLADVLIRQDKLDEADALVKRISGHTALRWLGLLISAQLAERRGLQTDARRLLEEASALAPDETEPLEAWCRYLFAQSDADGASDALTALVARDPENAAAQHNLGTVCLWRGQYEEAAEAYRASLRLRPESADTCIQLGHAFAGCGRDADAISAWREALRIAPDEPRAVAALSAAVARPLSEANA